MYEAHPAAELFPLMDNVALAALIRDIKENGLQEPILLWEGKILDGRNRLKACEKAGVEPRFQRLEVCDSPTAIVISKNLHRRHLSVSQRAMLGALAKREFAKEARLRQEASRTRPGRRVGMPPAEDKAVATFPPLGEPGKARDQAAELVGVSGRTIDAAHRVLESKRADLVDAVQSGQMTVSKAAVAIAQPPTPPEPSQSTAREQPRIRRCSPKAFLDTIPIETADLLISRPTFDTGPDHYEAHAQYWLGEAVAPMKYTSRIFLVCEPDVDMVHALSAACRRHPQYKLCNVLTWSHAGGVRGTVGFDYRRQHHIVFHLRGLDAPVLQARRGAQASSVHRDCATFEQFAAKLIRHCTRPGELVIDPSAGSGEVLVAAARLDRRALGATQSESKLMAAVEAGCVQDG